MSLLERGTFRDTVVRREIRDEKTGADDTGCIFTDAELNIYQNNAILALSEKLPKEVKASLALIAGQADYSAPSDLVEIVSVKTSALEFAVTDLFGGLMTLSPTPTASEAATFKYKVLHDLVTADSGAGSQSSFEARYEPLIAKHIKAQCYETLAGDGAKYYDYTEGDIRESQGKTQAQFRDESESLMTEFDSALAEAKQAKDALAPTTTATIVGVINHKAPAKSMTIFKS